MIRRPPRSTRTDTLFPYTTLVRSIINQNIHVFGMDRPFTILDPEDATQIVKKVMEPIKADDNRNWLRASTVAKAISFAGNTRIPIGQAIERKCTDYLDFEAEIAAIPTAFTEYKLKRGLIDHVETLILFEESGKA